MGTRDTGIDQQESSSGGSDRDLDEDWSDENWKTQNPDQGAHDRSHVEQSLTVREAIRAYPMAIFWCLAVSFCVIMEGYDTILIGNLYAFPTFQRKCKLLGA